MAADPGRSARPSDIGTRQYRTVSTNELVAGVPVAGRLSAFGPEAHPASTSPARHATMTTEARIPESTLRRVGNVPGTLS